MSSVLSELSAPLGWTGFQCGDPPSLRVKVQTSQSEVSSTRIGKTVYNFFCEQWDLNNETSHRELFLFILFEVVVRSPVLSWCYPGLPETRTLDEGTNVKGIEKEEGDETGRVRDVRDCYGRHRRRRPGPIYPF